LDTIEKTISNLIENQFPAVYREEGPVFVQFIKTYYEWMESSNNALYHARHLYEYKDIDETVDDFIVYFKEKYLKNIPITSNTDIRNLVKHSLDLYRSKGTERGVDLLFKLVFGQGTKIYYPSEDIFRLDDGKWIVPMYLEVSLNNNNVKFINKQIFGLTSKATAFVERVVRRTINNRLIDVLYISAIHGNFVSDEKVQPSDLSLEIKSCPFITGSLTNLSISADGTGSGFAIGEIVDVISEKGQGAKAKILAVSDITGTLTFSLINNGYGYSNTAEVIISENILTVNNMLVLMVIFLMVIIFSLIMLIMIKKVKEEFIM
jgi:hypothetical protein